MGSHTSSNSEADGRAALEYVPCPMCGTTGFRPLHRVSGYAVVDCGRCGLTYVNPQPTEAQLAQFYDQVFHTPAWYDRFPHLRNFDYFHEAAADQAGHQSYIELVRPLVFPGRWLDVGCGHGRLAALAAVAGYEAYGVDPNPLAIEAARRCLGSDRVFAGQVETAGLMADSFDVLAPGGMILIQTPNLASLQYRHQGPAWEQFTPPGHLIYFTPRTLRRMLKAAGFRRVRFDMRFPLGAGWDYGSTTNAISHSRLSLLFANCVSLLGSRCELAAQRLKGRILGKHDIVCVAWRPLAS